MHTLIGWFRILIEYPQYNQAAVIRCQEICCAGCQILGMFCAEEEMCACSVVSDSLWLHGLQPARLLCPWDFPGKNTGVGCHFLLQEEKLVCHKSRLGRTKSKASVHGLSLEGALQESWFGTSFCFLPSVLGLTCIHYWQGFPSGAAGKESTYQCRRHRRLGFNSLRWEDPWREKWQPTPVFLPEKSHGQRSLAGYSPWGRKESDNAEQLSAAHYGYVCKWACCRARGTPLRALWGPEGEGNPKPRGRVCVRGAESLRFCRNEHSIVKQLCASKNFKKEKLSGKALLECRGEI